MSGFETTVIGLLVGQLVVLCLGAAKLGRLAADIEWVNRKGGAR